MSTAAFLFASALLCAQAPIPNRPEQLPIAPLAFKAPRASEMRETLKNGIPAFLVADPSDPPLVEVVAQINGGALEVPPGKEGLVALFADLLRSGGTARLSAERLDARLDALAATLRVQPINDNGAFRITLSLLEKDLAEGLQLLRDVLECPAFAVDRFNLATQRLRQQIQRLNDDPQTIEAYQALFLTRGEGHPSARLASLESLAAITPADLRALHTRLLHPGNIVVGVGGHFDRAATKRLLDQTLGTLKAAPGARPSPPLPAAVPAPPGLYLAPKEGEQARISLYLPGLRRSDPDWPAVEVMNDILGGGGFSSRLTLKIRTEEGLAYHVGSWFTPGFHHPGRFQALFQTKNRSAAYALRLAVAELARIQKEPVGTEELQRSKGALINSFPADFSQSTAVARTFVNDHALGADPSFWVTYRDRIQAVTAEDIQRVAKRYLAMDRLVVLCVGHPAEVEAGDPKGHPGALKEAAPVPLKRLPLRDPNTMKPLE